MLATIATILVIVWILGLVFKVAGGIIHLVLVVALVLFVFHFLRGRTGT